MDLPTDFWFGKRLLYRVCIVLFILFAQPPFPIFSIPSPALSPTPHPLILLHFCSLSFLLCCVFFIYFFLSKGFVRNKKTAHRWPYTHPPAFYSPHTHTHKHFFGLTHATHTWVSLSWRKGESRSGGGGESARERDAASSTLKQGHWRCPFGRPGWLAVSHSSSFFLAFSIFF